MHITNRDGFFIRPYKQHDPRPPDSGTELTALYNRKVPDPAAAAENTWPRSTPVSALTPLNRRSPQQPAPLHIAPQPRLHTLTYRYDESSLAARSSGRRCCRSMGAYPTCSGRVPVPVTAMTKGRDGQVKPASRGDPPGSSGIVPSSSHRHHHRVQSGRLMQFQPSSSVAVRSPRVLAP